MMGNDLLGAAKPKLLFRSSWAGVDLLVIKRTSLELGVPSEAR